jgi:methylphosphotriester-DNA--protein-cysteine methyltransferase
MSPEFDLPKSAGLRWCGGTLRLMGGMSAFHFHRIFTKITGLTQTDSAIPVETRATAHLWRLGQKVPWE